MAQLTRAQLLQLILDELPTNGNQEITAEKLRTVCDELVSSTNNIADDTLLASVVAGANITIDNTDPENICLLALLPHFVPRGRRHSHCLQF